MTFCIRCTNITSIYFLYVRGKRCFSWYGSIFVGQPQLLKISLAVVISFLWIVHRSLIGWDLHATAAIMKHNRENGLSTKKLVKDNPFLKGWLFCSTNGMGSKNNSDRQKEVLSKFRLFTHFISFVNFQLNISGPIVSNNSKISCCICWRSAIDNEPKHSA